MTELAIGVRRRRLVNRVLRSTTDPFLEWLFHWLDLNDRSGQPNHSKILSTFAFFLGCAGVVASSWYLLMHETTSVATFGFILAYSALVFSLPFGLAGYKVWASTKGGGTVEAASAIAQTFEQSAAAALKAASGEGREKPEGS